MKNLRPDEPLDWKTYVITVVAFNVVILLVMYLVASLLHWGV